MVHISKNKGSASAHSGLCVFVCYNSQRKNPKGCRGEGANLIFSDASLYLHLPLLLVRCLPLQLYHYSSKTSGKSGFDDFWGRCLHLNFGFKNGLRGLQIEDKFLYSDMDFHLIFTLCFQKELSVCLFN